MPVACSGSLKDASAVVKTDTNELFVVCREVDRNLLLYFWEIVSNLLTRAATCTDGNRADHTDSDRRRIKIYNKRR